MDRLTRLDQVEKEILSCLQTAGKFLPVHLLRFYVTFARTNFSNRI